MPRTDARPLTPGERKMAAAMFGDSIDYDSVTIRHSKWWPFQPRNTLMAPCGHVHVAPQSDHWSEDYSRERLGLQALLLHEMTHVLQAQQRGRFYLPLMRHPFCRYPYSIQVGWRFERYGLEQQAEIVRHAFLLRNGISVPGNPGLAALESILPFKPR